MWLYECEYVCGVEQIASWGYISGSFSNQKGGGEATVDPVMSERYEPKGLKQGERHKCGQNTRENSALRNRAQANHSESWRMG